MLETKKELLNVITQGHDPREVNNEIVYYVSEETMEKVWDWHLREMGKLIFQDPKMRFAGEMINWRFSHAKMEGFRAYQHMVCFEITKILKEEE